jgi:hypothetical protein
MTVIRVPRTPASAMDPNRRVSALLKNQILHLQEAELRFPAHRQTNIYINDIKTEGQASEYIRQVTAELHPQGASRKTMGKAKSRVIPALAAKGVTKRGKKKKVGSEKKKR